MLIKRSNLTQQYADIYLLQKGLRRICVLSLVMWWMGNLLLFARVRMFCHSAILFSAESGSDVILLIK